MDSEVDVAEAGRFDGAMERGDATMLEAALGVLRTPLAYLIPIRGWGGRVVDFVLRWANLAYVTRFASQDDAIGRPLSQLLPLKWRDSLLLAYVEAFEQQVRRRIERTIDLDGRVRDLVFELLPTPAGLTVSVEDCTARKHAESELALTTALLRGVTRAQERFLAGEPLKAVLAALLDLAIELTGSSRGFIAESLGGEPALLRIRGARSSDGGAEIRAAKLQAIADGKLPPGLESMCRAILRTGEPISSSAPPAELTISAEEEAEVSTYLGVPIRRHDQVLGVLGVANRRDGYDGWAARLEPLAAAAGAMLEAANQAAERERVEGELRRSDTLLREAQEIAALGAYTYVLSDGAARWTRQMYALLGVPLGERPLSLTECAQRASDDYRQALCELFACVMKDGQQRDLDAAFRVDGKPRHLQVVMRGRRDAEGRVVELHGTLKDVTERKQVEEGRIRFEQQLAETQRLEALGLLAGGIAHDVNNLLVGVLANAQLIREDLSDDEHKEIADEIETAARRMAELTRQILDYAGRSHAAPQLLELDPLTFETVQLVRRTQPKSATIEVVPSAEPLTVMADAAQLRQVVMNLVINAGDALGGSPGRVTVETRADRGADGRERAILTVSDTGVGMSDEVRRRIFDPFFTTKTKGRGLGLSAVHGIVRRFGGTIEVESVPLRGSTFRVALPLAARPATPALGAKAEVTGGRPLRVLVVDDEELVRKTLQRMLERMRCQVVVADGGRAALEAYAATKDGFDVVLLDVLMPYLSGADVLREIRRISPRQHVVMMSGFVGRDEHVTTHANGFLTKPFTAADLEGLLLDAKRAG